jgi:glycosyltransferase involved in cell wall biosynthesis
VAETLGPLRVALVAGTLVRGGAEKQLYYMGRALREAGVDLRVLTLGADQHFEEQLSGAGVEVIRFGQSPSPLARLRALSRFAVEFRPHVLQAGHFFTNLYVTAAGRWHGCLALGAIRSDTLYDVASMGRWGRPSLRLPPSLVTNSERARHNAARLGVPASRIHVIGNVIELNGRQAPPGARPKGGSVTVALIGRLVPAKRVDRFLEALARARAVEPALRGVVAGQGPERERLMGLAGALGLASGDVEFLGATGDVAAVYHSADLLALTSDHEGVPNVILEAMAAGLPVVTTPAGDAAEIVRDGVTGYVVPPDDSAELAERFVRLARSTQLRVVLGAAGRSRVAEHYAIEGLAGRLLRVYAEAARYQRRDAVLRLLT